MHTHQCIDRVNWNREIVKFKYFRVNSDNWFRSTSTYFSNSVSNACNWNEKSRISCTYAPALKDRGHFNHHLYVITSLDFTYIRPYLVLLQFNFDFLTQLFCNLNLDINSMFVRIAFSWWFHEGVTIVKSGPENKYTLLLQVK